jgi:hypothetical protein
MGGEEPDPMLAAAIRYAAEFDWRMVILHRLDDGPGGPVCSCEKSGGCKSGGKHPRLPQWPKTATSDAGQIRDYWKEWPGSNVGVALGSGSGIVAIDVDPPNGEDFLAALANRDLPQTLELTTGKGRSLLYAIPEGIEIEPKTTCYQDVDGHESIRLQGTGAQRVLPPSRHPSGRRYAWVPGRGPGEVAPAPMPGWLIREMCRPEKPPQVDTADGPADPDTPWADFNRRGSFVDFLRDAGAKLAGRRGDTTFWTRPGKDAGVSASLGHCRARDGTPALFNWSGNWPGLPPGCYDLFGAFTRLVHKGDFAAAARDLLAKGFGARPIRGGAIEARIRGLEARVRKLERALAEAELRLEGVAGG